MQSCTKPGLVLDDFLSATDAMRKEFDIPSPAFGWKEIERYEQAQQTLDTLVDAIIDRHDSCIYCRPHLFLSGCGANIYSEQITTGVYSGFRISPDQIRSVLAKVFELALQTVVQLPVHAPKVGRSSQSLRRLASHLTKVAAEAQSALDNHEARQRVLMYLRQKGETDPDRIFRIDRELSWGAEILNNAVSKIKVARPKWDSPKPQVSYALYVVEWLEAATGRQYYEQLSTLLTAAFHDSNANEPIPKWVERLAIEMNSKRLRRKKLAKTRTSLPLSSKS